jgi:4-amino-4-deoxy-L-arabinose transferase-like glycosyltransferase
MVSQVRGGESPRARASGRPGSRAWLLLLGAAVYLAFLGAYPLLDPDEGRYAEMAREMIESGDWLAPRLNYVDYFEKPPLFTWLQAASLSALGLGEWGARLPAALAGLGTLALVVLFGARFLGPRAGLLAGWVHLTALLPMILARYAIIDGLFAFTLTATWFAGWCAFREEDRRAARRWSLAASAALGLAVMTKGIAALALTALVAGAVLVLRGGRGKVGALLFWPGPLLFALIVVPWHLLMELRHPGFLHFYVVVQHFGRLVQDEHARPFWFFLVLLPVAMLPWTLLLFPALADALRRGLRARRRGAGEPGDGTALFLLICAAAVVLLFSASRSKIPPYILPALAPLSLLLGAYLDRARESWRAPRLCAVAQLFLCSLLFVGLAWGLRAQDAAPPGTLRATLFLAAAAFGLGILALGAASLNPKHLAGATGLITVLLLPALVTAVAVLSTYNRVGVLVRGLPTPLPAEVRVAEYNNYDRSLGFYLERRIVLIDEVGELAFGRARAEDEKDWFLDGLGSLRDLAAEGPLLAVVEPPDWPAIRAWGLLHPVAANTTNLMLGNEDFLEVTGLVPLPEHALEAERPLLLPHPASTP